jgi:hypothetical protein
LLAAGLDVVAVEPGALRGRLAAIIGGERVREASPRRSHFPTPGDAVNAADGFHWFNHAQALAEIRVCCGCARPRRARPFRTGAGRLGRTSSAR